MLEPQEVGEVLREHLNVPDTELDALKDLPGHLLVASLDQSAHEEEELLLRLDQCFLFLLARLSLESGRGQLL